MTRGFKSEKTFVERQNESAKVLLKHSDRIPVICERQASCTSLQEVDKKRYLVPRDLTFGQFIYVLRKRMALNASQAIFLFTESGSMPSSSHQLQQIYSTHADPDGFLYLRYSGENTFGVWSRSDRGVKGRDPRFAWDGRNTFSL